MSLERFQSHLRDPAPGFRCSAAGDESNSLAFVARVRHEVGKPGSVKAIGELAKQLRDASPALVRFYELHDGVVLYRDAMQLPFWRKWFKPADVLCDAEGVRFFEMSQWKSKAREMRNFWIDSGSDEADMPDWFHRGIVFGEIPNSANYFVIDPEGENAGTIYYCDHDDFATEPFAKSFEDFLGTIVDDPPKFLYETGCFARYSDGKTGKQWIPREYVADCSQL
jgi:hypothetical protein